MYSRCSARRWQNCKCCKVLSSVRSLACYTSIANKLSARFLKVVALPKVENREYCELRVKRNHKVLDLSQLV
jgi:hypothetical protein